MALQKVNRNLLNTGVSDSSDATAITIDSSENVTFAGTIAATSVDASAGFLNGSNGGIRIHTGGTKFFNITAANAARDNHMDIGASDARFKDLYIGGAVKNSSTVSLDAGNAEIHFLSSGTTFGKTYVSSGDFYFNNPTQDKDIVFAGDDGGSSVEGLRIDMSVGGQLTATALGVSTPTYSFNNDNNTGMTRPTSDTIQLVTGGTSRLRLDGSGNVGVGFTPTTGMTDSGATLQTMGPIGSGRSAGSYAPGDARTFRDWFVYAGPVSGINRYVHMKTDLWAGGSPSGNTEFTMSVFRYHSAYQYGGAKVSEGMIGWHNWSGTFHQSVKYNPNSNWEIVKDSYTSSDGYVVLVADILATGTYACFSIDWHQWGGYTLRNRKVTAVTQNASATGAY